MLQICSKKTSFPPHSYQSIPVIEIFIPFLHLAWILLNESVSITLTIDNPHGHGVILIV
jgi:hypothetical protein